MPNYSNAMVRGYTKGEGICGRIVKRIHSRIFARKIAAVLL